MKCCLYEIQQRITLCSAGGRKALRHAPIYGIDVLPLILRRREKNDIHGDVDQNLASPAERIYGKHANDDAAR
jgi:hypothetical protein